MVTPACVSAGMSRMSYNQVLPYTRPVGASDEDAARAVYLRDLRPSAYRKTERADQEAHGEVKETLIDLAARVDKKNKTQERFAPPAKQKNLRNREFLIAMIMDDEGRSAAVPPVYYSCEGYVPFMMCIVPPSIQCKVCCFTCEPV